ncbi:putative sulfate exporter family transporter [Chitinophaga sp.]|uniref:YeiH family protein n=1 Tax=Chitinophaga sp. TaxID=1869181 RepID=UPI0031D1CBE6
MEKTFLDRTVSLTTREVIFLLAFVFCLTPLITPPVALLMGLIIAQFVGHPYLHLNHKATHLLLQISVVGLGFGMNVTSAMHAGSQGLWFTVASIVGTLSFGLLFGKLLKIDKKTSYLIAAGTAICGGSAIAAISPVIRAEEKQISVALGTIFILNSLALFIFPVVGHLLNLTQVQFGLWSAIAIHDTSSVVGAASKYGVEALQVATTVKLARALWIIPLSLLSSFDKRKVKVPLFIGFFIIAMVLNTYVPFVQAYGHYVVDVARAGLTLTLFLIGCGLNAKVLRAVGIRPFVQGVVLWVLIAGAALWSIVSFV